MRKKLSSGKCELCGNERKWLHKHHIVPRSRGGSDDSHNLKSICANCHEDIHDGPYGGPLAHQGEAVQKQRVKNKACWDDPVRKVKRLLAMHKSGHARKTVENSKTLSETIKKRWSNGIYYHEMFKVPKEPPLSRRYKESNRLYAKAVKITPGGAQTLSKQPGRFPIGAFPLFAKSGDGGRIIDVDGNEFIDWVCALGAVTLGYKHPAIVEAVKKSIGNAQLPLPCKEEEELIKRLINVMPAAESVRLVRTGTEACMAAVRIARMATGREVIVTTKRSYHGWADWYIASRDPHKGVPECLTSKIRVCDYNDLDAMRDVLDKSVACVIMEPTLMTKPDDKYLGAVMRIARANGSIVIWDENILGYRLALGGGSEFYHATPDMAVYGKAMGGGVPMACVVGRKEIMKHAEVISGTFLGDRYGIEAALAVLDVYKNEPVIDRLHEVGRQLQDSYNQMAEGLQLQTKCVGPCWHPTIVWECENKDLAMSVFLQETARRGVLFHPSGFNTSAAFTNEDVIKSVDACWATLKRMKHGKWDSMLKGKLIETFAWRQREPVVTVRS
jgi:glutamate-1-semialdehyde aminotransferase